MTQAKHYRTFLAAETYVCRPRQSRNAAGITSSVSTVALTMPPTMGAAMRRMTSEPVPPPSMMGSRPAMMAATVEQLR